MGKFGDDLSKRLRGKSEDKDLARQAVERDRQRAVDIIADAAARHPATGADQPTTAADGPPDFINIEIGARHELNQEAAERRGMEWRDLTARFPRAYFIPTISGYDEDPRALWDFPQVCEYMQRWAKVAGIRTIDDMPNVNQDTIGLFAACGVFGSAMGAEARAEAQEKFGSNPTEQ